MFAWLPAPLLLKNDRAFGWKCTVVTAAAAVCVVVVIVEIICAKHTSNAPGRWSQGGEGREEEFPEELQQYLDKGMVDKIVQEIDYSAVLDSAAGPRSPPTGMLLFGPPGTGK